MDLLSKSLLYTEVEAHWQTNASTANCRAPFSLLQQHTCSDNPPNSNRGPLIPVAATQTPRRPLFVGDSNGLVDGIGSAQKRKSRGDDNDLERVDKRARMDDSMEIVSRTPGMNLKCNHFRQSPRPSTLLQLFLILIRLQRMDLITLELNPYPKIQKWILRYLKLWNLYFL